VLRVAPEAVVVNTQDDVEDAAPIWAEKLVLVAPCGTVTDFGAVIGAPELVEYPTAAVNPPAGAGPVSVNVQTVEPGV
jgi:hypothetical protein